MSKKTVKCVIIILCVIIIFIVSYFLIRKLVFPIVSGEKEDVAFIEIVYLSENVEKNRLVINSEQKIELIMNFLQKLKISSVNINPKEHQGIHFDCDYEMLIHYTGEQTDFFIFKEDAIYKILDGYKNISYSSYILIEGYYPYNQFISYFVE